MANFATHIGYGAVVSGALATVTMATGLISPDDLIAVSMAGILGSVLPDVDLQESRPSRMIFSGLAIFASFALLFVVAEKYSIVEMLVVWLGTLAFVRYGLHMLFHRYAIHRGIWHSILAAVFASTATAIVFVYVLGRPDYVAWLGAGFMFVGFMTHLILDEVYSVDVLNRRVKASFGTALKFIDHRHPSHTAAMAAVLMVALFVAPSAKTFASELASRDLWSGLRDRLLPRDQWFRVAKDTAPAPGEAPPTQTTAPEPNAASAGGSPQ